MEMLVYRRTVYYSLITLLHPSALTLELVYTATATAAAVATTH